MRGLIVGVPDKSGAIEVGVKALHDTAVAEAVPDFLVADSPEFLFPFELDFAQTDGLFLGHQLAVEIDVCGYTFVLEL